jgi:hypothetical protein
MELIAMSRGQQYPTELRERAVRMVAELRRGPGGRPMVHTLRAMLDAVRYVVKYGIEWRALPGDFPPVCPEREGSADVGERFRNGAARTMKVLALRSRPAEGGFKPPRAALAEDRRGER